MTYQSRIEKHISTRARDNGNATSLFGGTLNSYAPDDIITKQTLCRLFDCSGRSVERMVARRVLPPPVRMGGKRVWHAETLGVWLADAAKRKQSAIETEAARIRVILSDRWNN